VVGRKITDQVLAHPMGEAKYSVCFYESYCRLSTYIVGDQVSVVNLEVDMLMEVPVFVLSSCNQMHGY
jgi:hypothetical protein